MQFSEIPCLQLLHQAPHPCLLATEFDPTAEIRVHRIIWTPLEWNRWFKSNRIDFLQCNRR